MTYRPDLRDESWLGAPGHKHARAHDPAATVAYNEAIKRQELEKARKAAEKKARTKQHGFAAAANPRMNGYCARCGLPKTDVIHRPTTDGDTAA